MIWELLLVIAALLAGSYVFAELRRQPLNDTLRATAPGEFVRLSKGLTHFQWFGPQVGPVVVLVHGLSTPSPVYTSIAQTLAGKGARVLSYDLYGRGFSDRPFARHTAPLYRQQLEELLAAQEVDQPFVLVGYSMGGCIAADFAARYPQRLLGLTLLAPAGLCVIAGGMARGVPLLGDWLMVVFGAKPYLRVAEAARAKPGEVPGIGDVMAAELTKRGYLPAMLSSLRGVLAQDFSEEHTMIAKAGLPVLAVWGRNDTVVPISAVDALGWLNPHAQQVILEDADHAVTYTHGRRIVAEMTASFPCLRA